MKPNGPAIWRAERKVPTCYVGIARSQPAGKACYPTQHRAGSWYFSQKTVTVQGGYGTCFCRHGANFIEHYECRGTIYLTNGELSRYCYFVNSCGAVRICQALRFCLGGRSKSKNRDKQLTHIVRVMVSFLF